MAEVEYLGLARGSVSFKGVDARHNSTSSATSPYTFHMARPPHVSVLAGPNALRKTQSLQGQGDGATRNPISMANPVSLNSRGPPSGWGRGSEVEMRNTTGNFRVYLRHSFQSKEYG